MEKYWSIQYELNRESGGYPDIVYSNSKKYKSYDDAVKAAGPLLNYRNGYTNVTIVEAVAFLKQPDNFEVIKL